MSNKGRYGNSLQNVSQTALWHQGSKGSFPVVSPPSARQSLLTCVTLQYSTLLRQPGVSEWFPLDHDNVIVIMIVIVIVSTKIA